MITMLRPYSSFIFRHLDRSSVMDMPGVSSMIILELPMTPMPSTMASQSMSVRLPVRSFWESTLDSMASIRFTSCSLDISRLKIMQGRPLRTATWSTRFKTNAVLPMEGLAAISTKSEGCMPEVL